MSWAPDSSYDHPMPAKTAIADNLTRLIELQKARGGPLSSFSKIEEATEAVGHKVGRSTVQRIAKGETPAELDNLEAIARAFDLEPWQLLVPGMDPSNPPVLQTPSHMERNLYARLKQLVAEEGLAAYAAEPPSTPRRSLPTPIPAEDAPRMPLRKRATK